MRCPAAWSMPAAALYQRQAGFEDPPQAMFDYLRPGTEGRGRRRNLWRFCRDSAANLAWLEQQGALRRHHAAAQHLPPPDGC